LEVLLYHYAPIFFMNKVFSFALLAVMFASCQTDADNDPAVLTSDTTDMSMTTTPVATTMDTGNAAAPVLNMEAAPAANQSTAGLNPEHGKPGHRCDIPVGAALNSPPGTAPATAPVTSNAAPAVIQTQAPAPVVAQPTAENGQRLNPQHGQPGHDCAVPVGSPLKS